MDNVFTTVVSYPCDDVLGRVGETSYILDFEARLGSLS